MNENRNLYKINQDLYAVMIKKVTKDTKKYGNSLIPLSNEQLQEKIKEFEGQGFKVETYHQEEFDDGMRFIKDGEGLDDITDMSYADLKKFLNQCKREVEHICKKEILNGNLKEIRQCDYPFNMCKRVYNILFKYVKTHGKRVRNFIPFESLLYLVSCIGNIYDLIEVIDMLRDEHIYLYFLNSDCMTDDPDDICCDLDYLDILLNEYYLEDLLTIMQKNHQLSDEQYVENSGSPYDFDDISLMDTKEFEQCMNIWEL